MNLPDPLPIIAFQGEPGAYSEAAALAFFGPEAQTLPCRSFEAVFAAVGESKTATHGMLPIENSLAGSIHRNYDLLSRNDLVIVGEYPLRVSHCLLALPGVSLEQVRRVHSHPQALSQCDDRLAKLGLEAVAESDTAGSARLLVERGDRQAAVLASSRAAQVYHLNILAENMEDNPANFTRFLVVAPQAPVATASGPYKTSLVFSLPNTPGSLFKALSVFALREIDLTKIESRPLPGKPWEYLFYIDFIGQANVSKGARAIEHLAEMATGLRVLGTYPSYSLKTE